MFNLRLLIVALVWGINFSVVKFALRDFHPLSFTVVRFGLAALFLFSLMLLTREPFAIDRRDRFPIAKLGFIGITLYNLFFMYGLKYTTAANSALLISLSPLAGALIQAASGRERISARISTGLVLASIGVILIVRSHQGEMSFSSSALIGDLLTLIATISWAVYTIAAKPLLEKYSAIGVTAYAMAAGSVLLLPFSLHGLIGQSWSGITSGSWSALGFATFIGAGVAYVLWYQGVKIIGVTRTMVYHYLVPFVAVLFAALFLKESITMLQIIGGIAVLAGVFLVQSKDNQRPSH
jgi:drug/metabolite transporter (DMT)-like permease